MSFGGSVAAMISSLKANKRHRIATFDKIKHLKKGKHTEVYFENKASPKELEKLRAKIQHEESIQSLKKSSILLVHYCTISLRYRFRRNIEKD